jgi:hypothetical protein
MVSQGWKRARLRRSGTHFGFAFLRALRKGDFLNLMRKRKKKNSFGRGKNAWYSVYMSHAADRNDAEGKGAEFEEQKTVRP